MKFKRNAIYIEVLIIQETVIFAVLLFLIYKDIIALGAEIVWQNQDVFFNAFINSFGTCSFCDFCTGLVL